MVKGINKNVIILNDTGSEFFEQVIFIVSQKVQNSRVDPSNMTAYATQLLNKYVYNKERKKTKNIYKILFFAMSAICALQFLLMIFWH